MKSIQHKLNKEELSNTKLLKNSFIAGIIGFLSFLSMFVFWMPLSSFYTFGSFGRLNPFKILMMGGIYTRSLLLGLIFFLFFYLTLKYKQKSELVKVIFWIGIIGYSIFYFGYIILLFTFQFFLSI